MHRRSTNPLASALHSASLRYRLPHQWEHRCAPAARGQDPPQAASKISRRTRLEAMLWISAEPIPLQRLSRLAGLEGVAEARKLIAEIAKIHSDRGSAFSVVEVAGGVQLRTLPKYGSWLQRQPAAPTGDPEGPGLSGPAMETLTVVAHRQPAMRSEVEAIRGVGCGDILRQLLEADLLRIVGRSEELGRPLLYGTTDRFLQLFGLRRIDDLKTTDQGETLPGPTTSNESPGSLRAA